MTGTQATWFHGKWFFGAEGRSEGMLRADSQSSLRIEPLRVERVHHRVRGSVKVVPESGIVERGEFKAVDRGAHMEEPPVAGIRIYPERHVAGA